MMTFDLQTSSPGVREATHGRLDSGVTFECDWCGAAVRPETAVKQMVRGDDESQVVVLCAGCAFGTD